MYMIVSHHDNNRGKCGGFKSNKTIIKAIIIKKMNKNLKIIQMRKMGELEIYKT